MKHRFDLLLPLRLRRIYTKLLNGLFCRDDVGYRAFQRVGLLLCEIEREVGAARLKAIVRKVNREMSAAFPDESK